jgi:serine/threonine-protein kinase HipA
MRRLRVNLVLDPAVPRPLGTLAADGPRLFFEFAPEFLADWLPVSPFVLERRAGIQEHADRDFERLHGIFYDAMPDGWGRLLQDRAFARLGIAQHDITPLDRLAAVGSAGIGALAFDPAIDLDAGEHAARLPSLDERAERAEDRWRWRPELAQVADHAARLYQGVAEEVLPALLAGGGSPGGARPKVLAAVAFRDGGDGGSPDVVAGGYPELAGRASEIPEGYEPWIIKFPAQNDGPDAGAVESAYAGMAREAGIDMPPTFLFGVRDGRRFFGIQRFDRVGPGFAQRLHVHTLGGLIHADYRTPSCDYRDFIATTLHLTQSVAESAKAVRRMVFNVLAHNRDDHVRNFAFTMDALGGWRLSPAYDVTFSAGLNGEHTTSVNGSGARPSRAGMQQVAEEAGSVPAARVREIIEEVRAAVERWPEFADAAGVPRLRRATIRQALAEVDRLAGPHA